ncbi:MAG: O-antigen ligase family protein [Planctomycetia bacterium]|nr:O-antigen ligase family protein [Planctomycetia bacterium]
MFYLLLSCLAVLLVRPQDFAAGMEDAPLYLALLLLGCVAAGPEVLSQFGGDSLWRSPVTLCVLALLPATILSHLAHGRTYEARTDAVDFAKIVLLYLFVVAAVTTPGRFEATLSLLVVCASLVVGLAVLQYHEMISVEVLRILEQRQIEADGDVNYLRRLCAHGLFSDPNDLCLLLVLGSGICVYKFTDAGFIGLRLVWLAPLALFLYALALTQSRGGLLGFLLAVVVYLHQRFGGWKATVLAVGLLPALLLAFAGRQTNISAAHGDTGQDRIALWSEAFMFLREAPLFGIGRGEFAEQVGLVAHNSYLHCFAELGFLGGSLFLGAFGCLLWQLYQLPKLRQGSPVGTMDRFRPYLMGILAGFAGGLMTLSRAYAAPTFLMLALCVAYVNLVNPQPARPLQPVNMRLAVFLSSISVLFLGGMYVVVRVSLVRG